VSHVEFSDTDRARLAGRGIAEAEAHRQLEFLRRPPPPIVLERPCVVGDGVLALSPAEQEQAIARGRAVVGAGRVTKFVPASGAATRMFQALIAANGGTGRPSSTPAGRQFFERLDAFPFSRELRRRAAVAGVPSTEAEERALLTTLLETMRYGDRAKGLIPFHMADQPRTACEDQLEEGVGYTRDDSGVSRAHFTVVRHARAEFERVVDSVRGAIEARRRCSLDVGFSEQHPSTDTIAVDARGEPFRTSSGELLLRPAGHGALIENLEALQGDVVVIKNIDNILPPDRTAEVVRWKLVLIGVLARVQAEQPGEGRPLRVCGVVRNEGEPGGAPFWVRGVDGAVTRQIVEAAQVDATDAGQRQIFASSTHFNPVDLVCAVRDETGRPFALADFVDPATAFLSKKSYEGRELTALERPGLWNGAMAGWTTVFVEVPGATFAPVKTVFDLLRPEHQ
jgi:hypothetical protein